MTTSELVEAIKALTKAIEAMTDKEDELFNEIDEPCEPEEEEVTEECDVELGWKDGGLRMYLTHEGNVITRAGLGKVLELTSYAQSAGYRFEKADGSTVRGNYFKVFKKN